VPPRSKTPQKHLLWATARLVGFLRVLGLVPLCIAIDDKTFP